MKAIILCGGFGTRLKSVVKDVPKPMAPINEKPFLVYLLKYLQRQHVTEVIFSVHHKRQTIIDFFNNAYEDIKISYVIEDAPLGTGGAIHYALKQSHIDEPVFILNGDTFVSVDYSSLWKYHIEKEKSLTIVLKKMPDCSRYGKVIFTEENVTAFQEKGEHGEGFINAGIYLLNPTLFDDYQLPATFSFENEFLHPYVSQLKPNIFFANEFFIDIGIPEDYFRAEKELPCHLESGYGA